MVSVLPRMVPAVRAMKLSGPCAFTNSAKRPIVALPLRGLTRTTGSRSRGTDSIKHRRQPLRQDPNSTRRAEHSYGNEDGNEIGDDPDHNIEVLFSPFHELLIYFHPACKGIEGEKGDKEGNGERRGDEAARTHGPTPTLPGAAGRPQEPGKKTSRINQ